MDKRPGKPYDFHALGQAIKSARIRRHESRNKVCDDMFMSPRYLAVIENEGRLPSLQIFYELVTRYHISVDQFFYPDDAPEKDSQRRELDALLDDMSEEGLQIVLAAAQKIAELEHCRDTGEE